MEDLLGITYQTPDDFPVDPTQHGFDNNPGALAISAIHLQKYLDVANEALELAMGFHYRGKESGHLITFDPNDEAWRWMLGQHQWDAPGQPLRRAVFCPLQSADISRDFSRTGVQTIRATVAALPGTKFDYPPRLTLSLNKKRLLDVAVTASVDHPQTIEYHYFHRAGDMRFDISNGLALPVGQFHGQPHKLAKDALNEYRKTVPCLVIDKLEFDGNDIEPWPPASRSRIFFKGENAVKDLAYAREILERFMPRAYRRLVTSEEVDRVLKIIENELQPGAEFEKAVKQGLRVVLCSPNFLFLPANGGDHDPHLTGSELASRLSYFLWSSMPDDELSALATQGRLHEPDVLRAQVTRMLKAPRVDALTEHFCAEWLELQRVGSFKPDQYLYPTYDLTLQEAMVAETKGFFKTILDRDLDVANFLDSNWAMLNERMARHYGIAGVKHEDFEPTKIPRDSHRGGLLTQASILSMTSDGTRTKPVSRGKWILTNILGTPPNPPPPNAGQLPNIPEFSRLPLREQIRRHREIESCAACHAKIDPLGMVLENYDAIGSWRDAEIVKDPAQPAHSVTGFESDIQLISWAHEGNKVPVDPSTKLFNGEELADGEAFRAYLLQNQVKFHHCLAEKMFTYALGRPARFSDRPTIDSLTASLGKQHTLKGLIADIVLSDAFQSR